MTAGAVCAAALLVGATRLSSHGATEALMSVGALALAAVIYLVCTTEPVFVFTLAIVLTPLSGNWKYMGVPGPASPDRLLFVIGIVVVLFRVFVVGNLPRPRIAGAHLVMAVATLFAVGSALAYHVLFQKGPGLLLIETFGILPFLTFWLGPVVFPTARERRVVLVALVILGAYLGLTALFETINLHGLVFPRYILNPNVGLHYGRARGPFADAVANGVGLYTGAVASAIAAYQWRGLVWRVIATLVCALCFAGTVMTLERSIWIATAAATLVTLLFSKHTRRRAIPVMLAIAGITVLVIFAVPGLHASVTRRLHNPESVYDRQNTTQTALNMIRARPLLGFGWDQYQAAHLPYVQQTANVPLTATNIDLHSAYLTYGVELGLIGGSLWLLAVLLGAGGTAIRKAPEELEPWRLGLVAMVVFFLIGESAVPPTVFVNASLWLWAGMVAIARYPPLPPRTIWETLRERRRALAPSRSRAPEDKSFLGA